MTTQGGQHPQKRDVNAVARVNKAIKLRASKVNYEQIALQCGYGSRGAAHKAVMRELQRTVITNVEELRREELLTLDQLQTECMILAVDRNNRSRLFAIDRLLAIMERRARLLGLDIQADAIAAGATVIREYGVETGKV